MPAATTKIPHLLSEKTNLKPWVQCVISLTIDDLSTKILYDGDGRKNRNTKENEKQGKILRYPPIPLFTKLRQTVSGVRKQAGPTLSGWGILI